jgi:adenosine deaminase
MATAASSEPIGDASSVISTIATAHAGFLSMHGTLPKIKRRKSLRDTLQNLPKVDLHRHLEGSLRLSTLAEIARKHGVDLPSYDIEALRPYVQVTTDEQPDFHIFLEKFSFLARFYPKLECIDRIAYEAVADAAQDNIEYLELRFNPVTLALSQGFRFEEVVERVISAVKKAEQDFDIMVRLLTTIRRDYDQDTASRVVDMAIHYADQSIVGLDLAGDEVHYSAQPFAELFNKAKEAGLGITVHAGEATGAESVRIAIELLGADRIGHGVRASEDLAVMDLVRERGITLEVCPTSNIQTAAVKAITKHPLRAFFQIGLPVTINTDDPSVSNTTLTDEYMVAVRDIGVTVPEIKQMILTGVRAAFLPQSEKERLEAFFTEALSGSKGEPFGDIGASLAEVVE